MIDDVWIVFVVDYESADTICVCSKEDKAKEEWQKQIDKQIKNLKDMLNDKWLPEESKDDYIETINMYENLTLDNVKDANYSYDIPIIKKYEVI